jgi:hypothetical protein
VERTTPLRKARNCPRDRSARAYAHCSSRWTKNAFQIGRFVGTVTFSGTELEPVSRFGPNPVDPDEVTMTTGRTLVTIFAGILGAFVVGSSTPETAPSNLPPLRTLVPGGDVEIQQNVDVNVVLIGWDGLVDPADLRAHLTPFNGGPDLRDDGTTYLALRFDFDYAMFVTPPWFDDAFFGLLRSIALRQSPQVLFSGVQPLAMTPDQAVYTFCNVPTPGPDATCDFSGTAPHANGFAVQQNYAIDGPYVEQVLAQNLASSFGIDTRNPTVVLINWYGRADYIDHVYVDPYEPNPATGQPRWVYFNNMTGGIGGTTADDPETCGGGGCVPHRLWFHDLSAGPFFDTGSYNVTLPELFLPPFANGIPEYRIHHTADYLANAPGTYRSIDTLVEDLARLVNDTYLSQIAFAIPVYRTDITSPRLPYNVQLDVNRWNWDPSANIDGQLNAPVMLAKMNKLPYAVSAEINDQPDSRTSRVGEVYGCSLTSWAHYGEGGPSWGGFPLGQSCFGNRLGGFAGGDLYLFFKNRLNRYLERDADYEVPVFQFLSTAGDLPDLAGLADGNYDLDNYHQQFLWLWTSSVFPSGHNRLIEHETGHHLGFAHPFHGYRCLDASCSQLKSYDAEDDTFFSMNANAVSGVMGYTGLNDDFSVFERENLQRYRTWDYLQHANNVLDAIAKKAKNATSRAAVANADALATAAVADLRASNYAGAVQKARTAYESLLTTADAIHAKIPGPGQSLRRWYRARHGSFRQMIDDTTADLASHFDPRLSKSLPVRAYGAPASRLSPGASMPVGRTVPDLRHAGR